jgi:hypothetical protein
MVEYQLTRLRLHQGIWEGRITLTGGTTDDDAPILQAMHQGNALDGVEISKDPNENGWLVQVPVPAELLSDGVQTFLITDARTDTPLGNFTIIAGEPLAEDLRAEFDLMRAELDLLKRAFRRHCAETE